MDSLETIADRTFSRVNPGSPGCAVGVSRDGRTVLAKVYGTANLDFNIPLMPESVFEHGLDYQAIHGPRHYNTHTDRGSDSNHLDDLVREFLNKVDKALVKINSETGLDCVVICTEDNYSRQMQVADKPSIYIGYASINYNNTEKHFMQNRVGSWLRLCSISAELKKMP